MRSGGFLGFSRVGLVIALAGLVLVVLPFLGLAQTNTRLIAQVLIFVAFALSYDLLFGFTGIFSFRPCPLFWRGGLQCSALFLEPGLADVGRGDRGGAGLRLAGDFYRVRFAAGAGSLFRYGHAGDGDDRLQPERASGGDNQGR